MKTLLLLTALLCISSIALPAQSATDEYAMRAFAQNFMLAYNRQDIAALRAMYTTHTVEDTIDGIYGNYIAQSFEDRFTREDVTLFVHHVGCTWSDAEYALVATGTYETFSVITATALPYHGKTAYRNVMVWEDGQWKIAQSDVTPIVKTYIYQRIGNLAEWRWVFLEGLPGSGVLTTDVGRLHDDPNAVYALLEWPSLATAQAFFASPAWQKFLGKDEKPVVSYLEWK